MQVENMNFFYIHECQNHPILEHKVLADKQAALTRSFVYFKLFKFI